MDKQPPAGHDSEDALPVGVIARLGSPRLPLHNWAINTLSVTLLPDDHTAVTTGPDAKVIFWDLRKAKPIRSLAGHVIVAISADGKTLASKGDHKDRTIRLFDVETEKQIGQIQASHRSTSFRFSPDGRFLAVGGGMLIPRAEDVPLRLWEIPACKEVHEFPLRANLGSLAFSPDSKVFATAHNNTNLPLLQLWDATKGKKIRDFEEKGNRFSPTAIMFSPDGAVLAGVGNTLRAWNVETGKEIWQIYLGDPKIGNLEVDWASSVAFSPNGKSMAVGTGNKEGVTYLFEVATGRQRTQFRGGPTVCSVSFSPSGLTLASLATDGAPLLWDVTGKILAAKKPVPAITAKDLDAMWSDLGLREPFKQGWVDMRAQDGAKAWLAICALATHPEQAIPFLKNRLPNPKFDPEHYTRLKADLDNDDFAIRERACKELTEVGPAAIPLLRTLLAGNPSADAKQRIVAVLGQAGKSGLLTQELQCVRAVEALEYIGTPAAKALLQTQAQGDPDSAITKDAKAALDRLAKLPAR